MTSKVTTIITFQGSFINICTAVHLQGISPLITPGKLFHVLLQVRLELLISSHHLVEIAGQEVAGVKDKQIILISLGVYVGFLLLPDLFCPFSAPYPSDYDSVGTPLVLCSDELLRCMDEMGWMDGSKKHRTFFLSYVTYITDIPHVNLCI